MKKLFTILLVAVFALVLTACGSTAKEDKEVKVALLLSGPANDQGWNAIALEGLVAAEKEYSIKTAYMENVQLADMEAAYTDYASQGYDLIIGHGFQFGEAAVKVAKQFPDQYFMATEANSQAENMASYVMSCEQGAYVMGMMSASMSKTGKIGVVGGFEQPSIVKEVEAYKLGAKSVNPNITVYEIYISSWTDVSLGKEAGLTMINKGADVLYQVANQAGTGVIKAAEEKGILAFGNSYDQSSIAPNTVVASTVYSMPKVILTGVKQVIDGQFKGGVVHLGMAEEVVGISGYGSFDSKLDATLKDKVEAAKKDIISGSLKVPVIETPTK